MKATADTLLYCGKKLSDLSRDELIDAILVMHAQSEQSSKDCLNMAWITRKLLAMRNA